MIRDRVVERLYPRLTPTSDTPNDAITYAVKMDAIKGIECELREWTRTVPLEYMLGAKTDDPGIQRSVHSINCLFR